MGPRIDTETHSQTHGHGHSPHSLSHYTSSPSPGPIVEKLVRLKNSDPELFSQAWNKLPGSARENILSYLKKYPNLLEREYPLLLLHRLGQLSTDEIERLESRRPHFRESIAEPREPARKRGPLQRVPLRAMKIGRSESPPHEWTNGELLTHTALGKARGEEADASPTVGGKTDSLILAELREISRQNRTQNELMRRLLQALTAKG